MKLNSYQKILFGRIKNSFYFKLFLIAKLPLAFLTGLKLDYVNEKKCITSIKFKYLNKNPFGSIYFAALSMAAELSTGVYALILSKGHKVKIKTILISMNSQFEKKAKGLVHFECKDVSKVHEAVKKTIKDREPVTTTLSSIGRDQEKNIVAIFNYSWSFKVID